MRLSNKNVIGMSKASASFYEYNRGHKVRGYKEYFFLDSFNVSRIFRSCNGYAKLPEILLLSKTERIIPTPTTTKHPITLYHNQAMDVN